jgi:DNA-binding PadR family transcriptional regulator
VLGRARQAVPDKPLGLASFHVLLALAAGDRHGYAIIKEVDATTAGAVKLGPGTLYRVIKQMLSDGWIDEIDSHDERRRVYRVTRRGLHVAGAEAARLDRLVGLARERRLLPALAPG